MPALQTLFSDQKPINPEPLLSFPFQPSEEETTQNTKIKTEKK